FFEAELQLLDNGTAKAGGGYFRPRLRDAHHARKLDHEVRERLRDRALDRLYWPHRPRTIVEAHAELYDSAATAIGHDTPVTILEFGVAHGQSTEMFAARFRAPESRFVGFDSFIGLPEAWLMHAAGAFTRQGQPPPIADDRVG